MRLRNFSRSNLALCLVLGIVSCSLLHAASTGVVFEQSQIILAGNPGYPNLIPIGIKEAEGESLTVDEKSAVTLRTKWGAVLILFPETTLARVGDRITLKLTGTFEDIDSAARSLRFAVAKLVEPSAVYEGIRSLESPPLAGAVAYGWNFRPIGANNNKSEIFRKAPETAGLLSPVGGATLGFSTEPLNLPPGMPQNLTIKLEKTGPDSVSLTYEFEGIASQTVVDSAADNFSFNSFVLFLGRSTEPSSVKIENFSVSLDESHGSS